jgi:predicted kinase
MVAMAASRFSEFEGGPGRSGSDRRDVRCGRLIVVAGLPATGKTTLALALEQDLHAVRLCADDWMTELGIDLLDESTRGRVEQLQWRLAQRLLELAAVVVVEWGTWSRAERDALRERARALGAAVELRFLDASPSELWRRIESRDRERTRASRALTREDVEGWAAQIEPPDAGELALYDPPLS